MEIQHNTCICGDNHFAKMDNCKTYMQIEAVFAFIKQLQTELDETKQEGDAMWDGLNSQVAELQVKRLRAKYGVQPKH